MRLWVTSNKGFLWQNICVWINGPSKALQICRYTRIAVKQKLSRTLVRFYWDKTFSNMAVKNGLKTLFWTFAHIQYESGFFGHYLTRTYPLPHTNLIKIIQLADKKYSMYRWSQIYYNIKNIITRNGRSESKMSKGFKYIKGKQVL